MHSPIFALGTIHIRLFLRSLYLSITAHPKVKLFTWRLKLNTGTRLWRVSVISYTLWGVVLRFGRSAVLATLVLPTSMRPNAAV